MKKIYFQITFFLIRNKNNKNESDSNKAIEDKFERKKFDNESFIIRKNKANILIDTYKPIYKPKMATVLKN